MPVIKNIAFTLLIKINGRQREFNFRKRSEFWYDGDTNNDRGDRVFFKLEKDAENWKLSGNDLPNWMTNNESSISESVTREEKALKLI